MQIIPTSLINGNASLRAFEIDGLLHPAQPMQQFMPIILNNLEPYKLHRFHLNIDYALRFKTYQLWQEEAEETALAHPSGDSSGLRDMAIVLKSINKQSKVKDKLKIVFKFDEKPTFPELIFLPQTTWHVHAIYQKITRLILYCEPIYLLPDIEFNFSSATELETEARQSQP